MNDREILLNSIFFPRPSSKEKDEKDHMIEVEDDIYVAACNDHHLSFGFV